MLLCMNYNDFYKCSNILMRPTRQHDIQFHKPTKTFFERNLQKPDIRELRRPFNPKIAPSEFVPRAEPKVATGTMDLTLPCMLNLFRVIYSSSGKSFAYTTFYYTQTSKSGLSWTDAILIHPATLSQWPYAPLDWHTKGSASVKGTAVLEGTFLKFPWTCEQSKATKYHIRVGPCDTSDLMTVFPCF